MNATFKNQLTEINDTLVNGLIKELSTGMNKKAIDKLLDNVDEFVNNNKYKEIYFIYYGEPKAQPRARFSSKLNGFFDNSTNLRGFIIDQIINKLDKGFKPLNTEIEFTINFYLSTPKSFSKRDKLLAELKELKPTKKPDIDNLQKLLFDTLNKILYVDDSCIVKADCSKFYSCKPRVEVYIRYKINE